MKIIRNNPNILNLLCIFTVYCLLFTIPPLALAQSPTPNSIREEIRKKVQERIEQIQEGFKKRAFFGTLKEITSSTLIIETQKGEKRIKINSETKFFGPTKQEIKFTDLELGNFIIALGYWQENGALEGKRITVLPKAPKPAGKRYAIYGKVQDISKEEKILSVASPSRKDINYEVKVTSSTIITKKVEDKVKKVNFSEIELSDRVIVVGTKIEGSETLTAKLLHVIPGKDTGPEKLTPKPEKPTPTPTTKIIP